MFLILILTGLFVVYAIGIGLAVASYAFSYIPLLVVITAVSIFMSFYTIIKWMDK